MMGEKRSLVLMRTPFQQTDPGNLCEHTGETTLVTLPQIYGMINSPACDCLNKILGFH